MESPNDNSIIFAICHYPDMGNTEKETLINKLEDKSLQSIVSALAGMKKLDQLNEEERDRLIEIETNRKSKVERIRAKEIHARRNKNPSKLAKNLLKLRDRGEISEEALILFGISGALPVQKTYQQMTRQEQSRIWESRLEKKFGPRWRNYISDVFEDPVKEEIIDEWLHEGF